MNEAEAIMDKLDAALGKCEEYYRLQLEAAKQRELGLLAVIEKQRDYIRDSLPLCVLAQLGNPDMRTPIAHALAYPDRIEAGVEPLDLFRVVQLNFEKPDLVRFPCLRLAYDVLRAGGNAPAVLNAANEVAVEAFLEGRLPFLRIPEVISAALEAVPSATMPDLPAILAADAAGRAASGAAI